MGEQRAFHLVVAGSGNSGSGRGSTGRGEGFGVEDWRWLAATAAITAGVLTPLVKGREGQAGPQSSDQGDN